MNNMTLKPHRAQLVDLFRAALQAVDPYRCTARYLDDQRSLFKRGFFKKMFVIGFGKAVSPMVRAVMDGLGDRVSRGVIISKYAHLTPVNDRWPIQSFEAGHPLPDEQGRKATLEVIRLCREADERTLILCLISGGGSALLVAPWAGISLEEKKKTTDLLLKAGADIAELNTVRKHLSQVKGGRLAEMALPATLKSFILSDVLHNQLEVIASGPTAPDGTTYAEALHVLDKYGLKDRIPASVLEVLNKGQQGLVPETPKADHPLFRNVDNTIIGGNLEALKATEKEALRMGYKTEILSAEICGEAREAGRQLGKKALAAREKMCSKGEHKVCLISGGETTVTVIGKGKGGRNMELALAFAREVEGVEGISFLSAGTDGTDGPTDAAGAIVDGRTISRARALGLDPEAALGDNNSYRFFERMNELFITGPTRTNVMDIQIMLLQG